MINSKKVAEKRLKRKRLMAKRIKCHGSKISCGQAHPVKEKTKAIISKKEVVKKNWWTRLLEFLKLI